MEVLKKFKASAFAVIIVYLIVGLIMLLNPTFIGDAVNYIIGVLVIIYGIVYSISTVQKKDLGYSKFDLLSGILCISFGLFLVVHKDVFISLIPFCMGVILLMDALLGIIKGFKLKKMNLKRWWIIIVVDLIIGLFAIYIIINAKAITELLIQIIGGFLIVDALMDLFLTLRISRLVKSEVTDIQVIEQKD